MSHAGVPIHDPILLPPAYTPLPLSTPPYPTLPPRPPSNSTTSLTPSNLTTSLPPSNLTTSLPPSPNSTPSLIMLSSGVSELLERDSAGGTLRVVNTGVRVFERNLAKGLR